MKSNSYIMLLRLLIACSFSVSLSVLIPNTENFAAQIDKGKKDKEIYKYHELFLSVYEKIVKYYVEETNDKILIEGAIKGMLESLDRNNYLINEDDQKREIQKHVLSNEYGLIFGIKDDKLQVISALQGSPAQEADIQSGDWVWSIADILIGTNPSLLESYKILLDPEDSIHSDFNGLFLIEDNDKNEHNQVPETESNQDSTLENRKDEIDNTKDAQGETDGENLTEGVNITLLRGEEVELINRARMKSKMEFVPLAFESGTLLEVRSIYYIRPNSIESCEKLLEILRTMGLQDQTGSKSLIIDLRQNCLMETDTAISIAKLFLPANSLITSLHYYDKQNPEPFHSEKDGPFVQLSLGVLVDRGTAGGAEILASALALNKRAKTFGTKTFGYAFERIEIPVSTGSIMSLINATYHDPSGTSIYKEGFSPKFIIEDSLPSREWQAMPLDERSDKDPVLKKAVSNLAIAL